METLKTIGRVIGRISMLLFSYTIVVSFAVIFAIFLDKLLVMMPGYPWTALTPIIVSWANDHTGLAITIAVVGYVIGLIAFIRKFVLYMMRHGAIETE